MSIDNLTLRCKSMIVLPKEQKGNHMGLDIYGWIEIKDRLDDVWVGAVKVDSELMIDDRNQGMNIFLFSVQFIYEDALAGKRGIPDDASPEYKELEAERGGGHSWIYWQELEHLTWSERLVAVDDDPYTERYLMVEPDFKVDLTGGWELIFALMKTLAEFHGSERVRLVVGFT